MDVGERARLAFVQGWVESGGPMTDRVKASCTAAIEAARAHPDQPDLMEVTLQIGKLQGHWAAIFADREAIHDHYGPRIVSTYRALVHATVDVRGEVIRFRHSIGLDGWVAQTDPKTAGAACAMRMVGAVADTSRQEYRDAMATIGNAITSAETAGKEAGHLLAGIGEADDSGRSDNDHRQLAAASLGRIIRGSTTNVQRRLIKLAGPGAQMTTDSAAADAPKKPASEDEMVDGVNEVLTGDKELSSHTYGDMTIGQSFISGMTGAYVSLGLRQINWITAGDTRVCHTCERYEANNPYPAIMVPDVPHPLCRCITEPVGGGIGGGRWV